MNSLLRQRIDSGIKGKVPTTDSHRHIHQDHLTYTLQLEESLEVYMRFFHFTKGFIGSNDGEGAGVNLPQLRSKIQSIENDLRRVGAIRRGGC